MKVNLKLHISFVILLLTTTLSAQNLDKVGKKEMVTVHGGLNFSTITYASDGIAFPLRWICNPPDIMDYYWSDSKLLTTPLPISIAIRLREIYANYN